MKILDENDPSQMLNKSIKGVQTLFAFQLIWFDHQFNLEWKLTGPLAPRQENQIWFSNTVPVSV